MGVLGGFFYGQPCFKAFDYFYYSLSLSPFFLLLNLSPSLYICLTFSGFRLVLAKQGLRPPLRPPTKAGPSSRRSTTSSSPSSNSAQVHARSSLERPLDWITFYPIWDHLVESHLIPFETIWLNHIQLNLNLSICGMAFLSLAAAWMFQYSSYCLIQI